MQILIHCVFSKTWDLAFLISFKGCSHYLSLVHTLSSKGHMECLQDTSYKDSDAEW